MDEDGFNDLLIRVRRLTGLDGRDAAKVAFELSDDPRPQDIIDKAVELGYDVEKKHDDADDTPATEIAGEISMNPAEVLSEVYMVMPRVLCQHVPVIGRAPEEAKQYEGIEELIDELPDEAKLLLVKITLSGEDDAEATFWLRDEANDIDRPLGPINLARYGDDRAMARAFETLLGRLPKVLAADFN